MAEEFRKDLEPGAELGRSPSGAPGSGGQLDGGVPGRGELGAAEELESQLELEGEADREYGDDDATGEMLAGAEGPVGPPPPCARRRGGPRRQKKETAEPAGRKELTPQERPLVLDTWQRSGLGAPEFAPLVGLTASTLYGWRRRFMAEGPSGLMDRPRGSRQGLEAPGAHPAHDPDAEGSQSRLGYGADLGDA